MTTLEITTVLILVALVFLLLRVAQIADRNEEITTTRFLDSGKRIQKNTQDIRSLDERVRALEDRHE